MRLSEARELWTRETASAWQRALDAYPDVVAAQQIDGLVELDRWYREQLPGQLQAAQPAELDLAGLIEVVRWKMKRGEWRARNLMLVRGNADEPVRAQTRAAFQLAPEPRKPVATIAELAGVGPATASAVLAAYRPDAYPFLDDLIGSAIPDLGKPAFTLPYYVRYAAALRQRAEQLGPPWTAQSVGLAVWSAAGGKVGGLLRE
jgi:hypothetical protein